VRRENERVGRGECVSFRFPIKGTNKSDGVSQSVLIDEGFQFALMIELVHTRYQQDASGECLSATSDTLEEQGEALYWGNPREEEKDSGSGGNGEGIPESLWIPGRAQPFLRYAVWHNCNGVGETEVAKFLSFMLAERVQAGCISEVRALISRESQSFLPPAAAEGPRTQRTVRSDHGSPVTPNSP
jgi:hypothetical protein